MQNIELKVRHPDLDAARDAARTLGARYTWTRPQRDAYFAVPDARLKLRQMPAQAELILYRRPDGVQVRVSRYLILPVRDAAAAEALLAMAWSPDGVVRKVRELWLWENVRIHLDTVDALGTFVELEGVIGPAAGHAVTRERVERAIVALDLAAWESVPVSYHDLILADAVQ